MKTDNAPQIIPLPKSAPVVVDDNYLVEMTGRLHKLRALLGQKPTPLAKKNKNIKQR